MYMIDWRWKIESSRSPPVLENLASPARVGSFSSQAECESCTKNSEYSNDATEIDLLRYMNTHVNCRAKSGEIKCPSCKPKRVDTPRVEKSVKVSGNSEHSKRQTRTSSGGDVKAPNDVEHGEVLTVILNHCISPLYIGIIAAKAGLGSHELALSQRLIEKGLVLRGMDGAAS
mmetsp:Transcript_12873/g.20353  ORF Transcript_12873/g.20353 Transcript_12873/m.20353 type:complete len:173 (-) Transcript_12873:129-647(-)